MWKPIAVRWCVWCKAPTKRHGTLNLFAALEVGTGQVHTKFTDSKKREDFRNFLDGVLADQPPAKFEGRVQFHFTPTSASWLNQIEIVFSLLQRKTLNGASFKTKDQLREALRPSSKGTISGPNFSAGEH
jgi:ribosome-associated toxin RatA of RatAB toxin-antitoxin module